MPRVYCRVALLSNSQITETDCDCAAPRYSAFSDSRMSLSTLEESTPSLTSRSGSGREIWKEEREVGDGQEVAVVEGEQEEIVVWQDRCLELEDSLARFRDQAHRIREILKEKVGVHLVTRLDMKRTCHLIYKKYKVALVVE